MIYAGELSSVQHNTFKTQALYCFKSKLWVFSTKHVESLSIHKILIRTTGSVDFVHCLVL